MRKKTFLIITILSITVVLLAIVLKVNKEATHYVKTDTNVESYYHDTVISNKQGSLFVIADNTYTKVGALNEGTVLFLDGIYHDYFKIKDTDYYVHFSTVEKYDLSIDERYKKYVKIGKVIHTRTNSKLYQSENVFISLDESHSFEVIYIDEDKYYVIFNNYLYYILEKDIADILDNNVTDEPYAKEIAVLNYHFFYDKLKESCNEIICIEKNLFEEHLKYLKEADFLTLTMDEFNLWMDGNLKLPENSVLITIDDGALGTDTHLIELLEKYDMNASLFLITAWWPKEKYISNNLEIYSHGYDIHLDNYCGSLPRGLCLSKEEFKEDLNKSVELLGTHLAFCYPFYEYNSVMLEGLSELGFEVAFIGGNKKATMNTNKLLIPRYVIHYNTTVSDLKKMIN